MPRFILLSSGTGYIMGDTADLPGFVDTDQTPEAAARLLDASIGEVASSYRTITHRKAIEDSDDGYYVYRSDINGSDQIPNITDGTDQDVIEAVERDGEFVAFVARA